MVIHEQSTDDWYKVGGRLSFLLNISVSSSHAFTDVIPRLQIPEDAYKGEMALVLFAFSI
ncbi:hypothetical protein CEXT_340881, partial [Caerostris extrusa]